MGKLIQELTYMRNYGIVGLIILVLDILAIVEIIKSGKSTAEKLLWSIFILVAPLLGLIIYWIFGRGRGPSLPRV